MIVLMGYVENKILVIFLTVKLESVPLKFVSQNLDGKNILL